MVDFVPEHKFYTDDAELIQRLLRENWDLGIDEHPTIVWGRDSFMADARLGIIQVYQMTRSLSPASIDYRCLNRTSYVGVRVSNQNRERHYAWCDEVYRILMAFRRAGPKMLNGMQFLEVINDKFQNDLSGWYTTTFDVRLVSYSKPVVSAGFGTDLNRLIYDRELMDKAASEAKDAVFISPEEEPCIVIPSNGDDKT